MCGKAEVPGDDRGYRGHRSRHMATVRERQVRGMSIRPKIADDEYQAGSGQDAPSVENKTAQANTYGYYHADVRWRLP